MVLVISLISNVGATVVISANLVRSVVKDMSCDCSSGGPGDSCVAQFCRVTRPAPWDRKTVDPGRHDGASFTFKVLIVSSDCGEKLRFGATFDPLSRSTTVHVVTPLESAFGAKVSAPREDSSGS